MAQPQQNLSKNPMLSKNADSVLKKKRETVFQLSMQKFLKNKLAVIGSLIILLIIAGAVFAPWIAPHSPDHQYLLQKLAPPSKKFPLGTDTLGRDTLARILYGARVSLEVSFGAVSILIVIGTIIGAVAGYFGGFIDSLLMRFVDVIISFPSLFVLITLVTIFQPSLFTLIIVLSLFSWTGTARLVRGEFLSLRTREFVLAAKTMGVKSSKIIFSHILPNALGPIIVSATLQVGYVILTEAALSFLGLGVQPPTPSWGNMLQDAQNITIMLNAWWYPIFPGVMILITVLAFNFVGDGLRDAFDPKMKV